MVLVRLVAAATLILGTTAVPASGATAVPSSSAAYVPCPMAASPTTAPRVPPVPTGTPRRPTLGGDGLATRGLVVPPGAPALPTNLTARGWLVADLDTGAVLGGCGPHQPSPPASVQKLLLAEAVMAKLDPAQPVQITQEDLDFEQGSSAVGLLRGGTYTVDTLWLGLFLNSGNDAANVLARLGGGADGVPGAIAAMNAEARRLGARETHAVTPSGLDGEGQVTSAYDLALIWRAAFAREDFRRYVSTRQAQIPPQPPKDPKGYQIQNDNQLLFTYAGALGGKTGFTDAARHTYVGAAERGGRRLVVTILGAESQPARGWQQGAALLDWGFATPRGATVGHLAEPGEAEKLAASPTRTPPAAKRPPTTVPAGYRWWPYAAGAALAVTLLVLVLLLGRARRRKRRRELVRSAPRRVI